jgi:hypothetical protein
MIGELSIPVPKGLSNETAEISSGVAEKRAKALVLI